MQPRTMQPRLAWAIWEGGNSVAGVGAEPDGGAPATLSPSRSATLPNTPPPVSGPPHPPPRHATDAEGCTRVYV